ncbi:uncharacterized protein LOC132201736 isoform X2 [Neocloeon triangulifer]|uniref:uncharacterized protein LOC132201736 isoform X2 n=1 Tax=Neocloeon triangulifer TaxID=2078957 RepID=UPI00286F3E49|nr:uncharacterized protein LOC132201736 isoform X2 [Neocloeon triangulifer]
MKFQAQEFLSNPPDVGMDSDEGEGSSEPAHHARRPMNAFLIFCKRHRGVVREKYPTLENRCITKILGEWWAQLEPPEKACYTELAKKYKEAFLEANPDFKWYKLPAPPLRTLVTRPSNQKPPKLEYPSVSGPIVPGKLADETQMGGLSSLLSSPPVTPTSPTVPKPPKKRYLEESSAFSSGVTPLSAWEGTSSDKGDENSRDSSLDSEGKDSGLCNLSPTNTGGPSTQSPLLNQAWSQLGAKPGPSAPASLKTSQLIDRVVDHMCATPEAAPAAAAPSSWADVASRETNNNEEASFFDDEDKPNVTEEPSKSSGQWIQSKDPIASRSDMQSHEAFLEVQQRHLKGKGSQNRRKSVRACKGKRYQEFMSSGRITTGKRGRLRMYKSLDSEGSSKVRHNSGSSTTSEKTDSAYSEASRGSREPNEEMLFSLQGKITPTPTLEMDAEYEMTPKKHRHISECSEDSELDANLRKRFRAADFNLDEKIDALPSLSLEEFQQKKKAKKKRASIAPSTPKKHIIRDRALEMTPVSKYSVQASCSTPTKNPPLVGSQKRKARRLQITRVDPNSPHMTRDNSAVEPTVLMSDIGLATLAEVASATKRLIKQ